MLFNPSQVYMPSRHRQRSALRTFFPSSSFSPPDSKEPIRRGILFSSVAAVLMLVGTILTWLGFNDVFGGKISMTGPLLIALALLMLLLSLRQFMLARKRNRPTNGPVQMETLNTSGVTAVVVDHEDGNGAATIVVETWDSVEPITDTTSFRNNHDLAPPSYMDIAQSCSSNCPSLISHEDHNEAPPTYEETCGMYNSVTSLTNECSRRSSSQFEGSPSPQRTSYSGHGFFQNDNMFIQNCEMYSDLNQPLCQSCRLCPSTAAKISQSLRNNAPITLGESSRLSSHESLAEPHIAAHSGNDVMHLSSGVSEGVGANSGTKSPDISNNAPQWSRRSFSSIPSYTCLLSESGEVSSQVFDTSSIIEEMMPLLAGQEKVQGPVSEDLLRGLGPGPALIPTRSHSMSSVNTLRQGVPYNMHSLLYSSPASPGTASESVQFTGGISAGLSPQDRCQSNTSDDVTEGASSPMQDLHFKQRSDPVLRDFNKAAEASQATRSHLLQPQLVGASIFTSTSPSSWHNSFSEVTSEQVLETALDVRNRRRSESSLTRIAKDSTRALAHGKLLNTQDVQETI